MPRRLSGGAGYLGRNGINYHMTNKQIRKSRATLRLTQPEFAKRLRVSLRIVTKWERDGCPTRWDELIGIIVRDEGAKATS